MFYSTVFFKRLNIKKYITVGKIFEFAIKPEQLRLSSSICLEFLRAQTLYMQNFESYICADKAWIQLGYPGLVLYWSRYAVVNLLIIGG